MSNHLANITPNFFFAKSVNMVSSRMNWSKITTYKEYKNAVLSHPIFEGTTINEQQNDFLKYYYIFITTPSA